MPKHDEYIDYLLELMADAGPVTARAMFGGYGLFLDARMFALVADNKLYFKTCQQTLRDFERLQLEPFCYQRGDKYIQMSYSEAPADVFDDRDEMTNWVRKAILAANST